MGRNAIGVQQYALMGCKVRLSELLEEVVQMRQTFDSITALDRARKALADALDEIDGVPPRIEAPRTPTRSKQASNGHHKPGANYAITEAARRRGAQRSWHTGREVLAVLADHGEDGMTPKDLAKHLKLPYGTAYWRVRVRAKRGQIRLVDEDTMAFAITAVGLDALKSDKDLHA